MNRRTFILGTAGAISVAACSHVISPITLEPYRTTSILPEERAQTLLQMRPPKRQRPVIAILADNSGSETTDFIIPWSVLTRSGVADVFAVAIEDAPVKLMPALSIVPQLSTEQFTSKFPEGADYVIVPAFHNSKSPIAIDWIKTQRNSNSSIVGICEGAIPLAYAGLLEGKQATTHWYGIKKLKRISPTSTWMKDRRYVADNGIITSTGVSASLPLSLSLVEAIAGKNVSDNLARDLGVQVYDARHNSEYFNIKPQTVSRLAVNSLNIFGHEKISIEISDNVDELSLALMADAWSRTYRSKAYMVSASKTVTTMNGLKVIADFNKSDSHKFATSLNVPNIPGVALIDALDKIKNRYGMDTAAMVALQLEYPWQPKSELN